MVVIPLGVHLTGKLSGWATPKDLILHLAGKLTVRVSSHLSILMHIPRLTWFRAERAAFLNISVQACTVSPAQASHSRHAKAQNLPARLDRVGLATMANMGAEVGATTSTFPYTPNMRAYLNATGRGPVARAADQAAAQGFLSADEGAEYDEVIDIVSSFLSRAFSMSLH